MGIIRADLRDLDRLNIQGGASPLPPFPPRRILNRAEKAALKAALDLSALLLDAEVRVPRMMKQVIEVSENRPTIVVKKPNTVRVNDTVVTVALGINPEAFCLGGATGTVGIYASTTREVGVFLSGGPGFWVFSVGASIAGVLTVIFGPPSDLSGLSLGLGCDVEYGPTWGALLLFAPAPLLDHFPWVNYRFLGFSVSVGAGTPALLPVDLTYQVTYTGVRPMLRF